MRAKFGRDPMAGSKKVTLKFIIGLVVHCNDTHVYIIRYVCMHSDICLLTWYLVACYVI